MITSRVPFRISFFGGGTDFPVWYNENGGAVLSTTIDKYCYINCRKLPPFFEYKHRIVYSKYEHVSDIDNIVHPAVRETFRFMGIDAGLEIHHDGDLPARTGLASSSSFTVGLLHALYALKGRMVTKKKLALEAIHIEQNMIRENVGSQDQVAVAFGGFNKISFGGVNNIEVTPIIMGSDRLKQFQDNLMLFFTGFTRYATEIEKDKIKQIDKKKKELKLMHEMVNRAIDILNGEGPLNDFGRLLHENWELKRSLSSKVSTPQIDDIYRKARKNSAIGGKLLGAGGGGFMLFFVESGDRARLREALKDLLFVPFKFDTTGSQIIFYSESEV